MRSAEAIRNRAALAVVALALISCTRRQPFEDPAYASLPRINLSMVHHGGIALVRAARDVRYEVEWQMAEAIAARFRRGLASRVRHTIGSKRPLPKWCSGEDCACRYRVTVVQ